MTLLEMRALFRDLIFDKAPSAEPFDNDGIDRLLNAAMFNVYNLARALQRSLFLKRCTVTVNTSSGDALAFVSPPAPLTRVKKLLHARRLGDPGGTCPVREYAATLNQATGAPRDFPPCCLYNEGIAIIDPPVGAIDYAFDYLFGLPKMTHDTNTPGQTGASNEGQADALPVEYHPMLVVKAAVMALKAENAPGWQALLSEYADQKETLVASLQDRDDTAENG